MVEDLELNEQTANSALESGISIAPELLEEMTKAGVLYGRKKTKTHPRMRKYIFTTRNGVEILDIAQTWGLLEQAVEFVTGIVQAKGLVLLVGTTPAAKGIIKTLGDKTGMPFVNERWLGGTLTNFKTLSTRLQYFLKLRSDREAGRLEKYTKKERLQFDKELARMSILFGGLEKMTELPKVIIIMGATSHEIAVREANRLGIPVVAVIANDTDPDLIQYPIPANDRSKTSVEWVLERLGQAIEAGKKQVGTVAVKS